MNTRQLNEAYVGVVRDNKESSLLDSERIRESILRDATTYGTEVIDFLFAPKLFSSEIAETFGAIAETTYGILTKVMDHFVIDKPYRELFNLTELEEELILSKCGYEELLPIARIDLFYNEENGDFKFCEFNTDGSSGMSEELTIASGIEESEAYKNFSSDHEIRRYDLYEGFVDAFIKIYEGSTYRIEDPTFAIVDFLESGVKDEFASFARRFNDRGYHTIICDVRNLAFDGENLYYEDQKIDAIYRRAVTGEMVAKKEQIPQFLEAILSGKVCVIGHPRTQIAHVKTVFSVLHSPLTFNFLTQGEIDFIKRHIPFTTLLQNSNYNYNKVLTRKNRWVIKPPDEYASRHVTIGFDTSTQKWRQAVEEGVAENYLLQEYSKPFETLNCYFKDGELYEDYFGNMIGLYLYNGKFSGMFTRAGKNAIISSQHGGYSMGTMVVKS
jgi:hypothetical protein